MLVDACRSLIQDTQGFSELLTYLIKLILVSTDLCVQLVKSGRRLIVLVDGVGKLKVQLIDLILNVLGFRSP
jgi:hypothetical protein